MAEKEYIELGKVIDLLEWDNDIEKWVMSDGGFLMLLPADVVEVVRCKDCKHCVKYKCKNDACYSFTICRRRDGYMKDVEENDFCSYGERKEQE